MPALHAAKIALTALEVAVAHFVNRRTAARLSARRAQELGPTFIKLAQFLTTRSDVIAPEYTEALSVLRADARSDPPAVIKELLCRRLGVASIQDTFEYFEDEPLASASLAQVHLARLAGSQTTVAVKILKHGIEEAIERDIGALRLIAAGFNVASRGTRRQLNASFDKYCDVLRAEVDFEAEARNSIEARRVLARGLGDDVIVPRALLWRKGVIVMEYVPSLPLGRADDPRRVTALTMEATLLLITSGSGFHVDMHEGNIGLVRGGAGDKERVVLYDFGNVARLDSAVLDGMMEAGAAFQMRNKEWLADALIRNRLVACVSDRPQFQVTLLALIDQAFAYVDTMDIRSLNPQLISRRGANSIIASDDVNAVMRAVTMAEGVCKQAHAGFDLQTCIDEFIAIHYAEMLITRAVRDVNRLF